MPSPSLSLCQSYCWCTLSASFSPNRLENPVGPSSSLSKGPSLREKPKAASALALPLEHRLAFRPIRRQQMRVDDRDDKFIWNNFKGRAMLLFFLKSLLLNNWHY
ncbi:hypothetical protein AMTRI_Chr03g142500 [Amborella trichopoda]